MARKAYNGYTEKSYYENTKYYGIVATTDPLAEGYFRDIINFDISDTGASLKPRTGFLTTTTYISKDIIGSSGSFPNISIDTDQSNNELPRYQDLSDNQNKTIDKITEPCIQVTGSNLFKEEAYNTNIPDFNNNMLKEVSLHSKKTIYGKYDNESDVLIIPTFLISNLYKYPGNLTGNRFLVSMIGDTYIHLKLNKSKIKDKQGNIEIMLSRYCRCSLNQGDVPTDYIFDKNLTYSAYLNDSPSLTCNVKYIDDNIDSMRIIDSTTNDYKRIAGTENAIYYRTLRVSGVQTGEVDSITIKVPKLTIDVSGFNGRRYISKIQYQGDGVTYCHTSPYQNSGEAASCMYYYNPTIDGSTINDYPEDAPGYSSIVLRYLFTNRFSFIDTNSSKGIRLYGYVKSNLTDVTYFPDSDTEYSERLDTDIDDVKFLKGSRYAIEFTSNYDSYNYELDSIPDNDQLYLHVLKDYITNFNIDLSKQYLKTYTLFAHTLTIPFNINVYYNYLGKECRTDITVPAEVQYDSDNSKYYIQFTQKDLHLLTSLDNKPIFVSADGMLSPALNSLTPIVYIKDERAYYGNHSDESKQINILKDTYTVLDSDNIRDEVLYNKLLTCNTIKCQALSYLRNINVNSIVISPSLEYDGIEISNVLMKSVTPTLEYAEGITSIKDNSLFGLLDGNLHSLTVRLPSTLTYIGDYAFYHPLVESGTNGYDPIIIQFSSDTALKHIGKYALANCVCNEIDKYIQHIEFLDNYALKNIFEKSYIEELTFYDAMITGSGQECLYGFNGTIKSMGALIENSHVNKWTGNDNLITLEKYYKVNIKLNNDPDSNVLYIEDHSQQSYLEKSLYIKSTDFNQGTTLCTISSINPGFELRSPEDQDYVQDWYKVYLNNSDITSNVDIEPTSITFPTNVNIKSNTIDSNIEVILNPKLKINLNLMQSKTYLDDDIFFMFTYNHWNIYVTYYKEKKKLYGFINYDLSSRSVVSENQDNLYLSHIQKDEYYEHLINVDKIVTDVKYDELTEYINNMYKGYENKNILDYLRVDNHIATSYVDENLINYGLIQFNLLDSNKEKVVHHIIVKLTYNKDANIATDVANVVELIPYNTQSNYSIIEKNLASHNSIIPDDNNMQIIIPKDEADSSLYTQFDYIYAKSGSKYLIQYYNKIEDLTLIPKFTIIDTSEDNVDSGYFKMDFDSYGQYTLNTLKDPGLDIAFCYEIYSTASLIQGISRNININKEQVYRSPVFLIEDKTIRNISQELYNSSYYVYNGTDTVSIKEEDYKQYSVYTGTVKGSEGIIDTSNLADDSLFQFQNDLLVLNCKDLSSGKLSSYVSNGVIVVVHLMQIPYKAFKATEYLASPFKEDGSFDSEHSDRVYKPNPYASLLSYNSMVSASGATTQSTLLLQTTDEQIITTINQIDDTKTDYMNIDTFDGSCIFSSPDGDRMVVWKNTDLYMTVAANTSNTEGFFPSSLHFTFDEPIVKALPYRTIVIVFTTMNVYTIYPYVDTHIVNVQEQDEEGNITVKQQSQEYEAYAKMCVLYNILCDKKYADAIQIFNQMILFYSSDGQMYLIKPSATIDSDTRFSIQYFNKNVNDILANYHEYIQERLHVYNVDMLQHGYDHSIVTKDDVNIKVLASINYIKIFYCIPKVITYILIYDVINNRWLAYDTISFTDVTDVTFIESGDLYITKDNEHLYLTIPYKDLYIPDNNCDMSIVNNFQKEPINAELDTGNLDLNNHLRKRFRDIKTTYKNLDAHSLKYKTEVILDDVFIETFADRNVEVKNINNTNSYRYEYIEEQPDVELLDNQTVLFDISAFTSNKILTHTRSIVSVGKVIRFKLHFSSSGCYKVNSYGIIYKERTVR